MVLPVKKEFESEFDMYYTMISLYNTIDNWGLTDTQKQILVYLIRFGYSKNTKDIILQKTKITEKSLTTNLSYLRQGKIGKYRKIKKLLKLSLNNMNVTLLGTELNDIKKMIETPDDIKSFIIDLGETSYLDKINKEREVLKEYINSLKKEIKTLKNDLAKRTTDSN